MVKNIRIINKIIIILIAITMSITTFSNVVYARPDDGAPPGGYVDGGDGIKSSGKTIINTDDYKKDNLENNTKTLGIVGTIINVIQMIGIIIALISVGLLGIKYMTGSVEQKAEYKKTMVPFVVGVGLITVTTTIVKIIYETASKNIT